MDGEEEDGRLEDEDCGQAHHEVCPHCSLTSKLSGVRPRVASGSPPSSTHPLLSITCHPSTTHKRLYNKLLGACPPASLPTRHGSGHVLELVLFCLASQGCTWTCASSHRVAPRPGLLRGDDTSTCTVRYSAARTSCTRLVCLYASQPGPAQPSPLCFCLCIFLIMLHLPSFASWHLITEATTRASALHCPLCPGEDPCFSAPSPSGGAVVPPSLRPTSLPSLPTRSVGR